MRVLRVENYAGLGPYSSWTTGLPYCETVEEDWKYHPTPEADAGIKRYMEPNEHCGFANYRQLLDWFGGTFDVLSRQGFHLAVYDVPDEDVTAIGERQCLFLLQPGKTPRKRITLAALSFADANGRSSTSQPGSALPMFVDDLLKPLFSAIPTFENVIGFSDAQKDAA